MKQQQKQSVQQIMLARLLQIPYCSLRQSIEDETKENPLLEIIDDDHDTFDDTTEPVEEEETEEDALEEDETKENEAEEEHIEKAEDYEEDYREDYEEDYDTSQESQSNDANPSITKSGVSLMEMLQEQLDMSNLSDTERTIGKELIGSLDDSGYLSRSLDLICNDLAIYHDIDLPVSAIEKVLRVIQSFEPAGIGARSPQECLSLQLHRITPTTVEVKTAIHIVDHYFDEIVKHRYQQLADHLEIDITQLNNALNVIQHLNPKPGYCHTDDTQPAEYITEDFTLIRNGDELTFELNDHDLPRLRISPDYLEMRDQLSSKQRPSDEEKKAIHFIKTNTSKAQLFIRTLQQRELTLRKVMDAILRRQYDYFLTGDRRQIKPLMQKEIAEATELDLSTISRVVNDKYIRTDFGLIQLRTLFSQSVTNNEGESISSEVIKQAILEIINHEDKANPLTDEAICTQLAQRGFTLARRTVAKYRTTLGFPKGIQRKNLT